MTDVLPARCPLRRRAAALFLGLCLCFAANPASAHNPDTSYVRVILSEDWIETRFRFDLEVLEKIVRLDANGDGKVTREEFELVVPQIRAFLRANVDFEINEGNADFGEFLPAEWPETLTEIPWDERAVTLVDFPFKKRIQEMPESVLLFFRTFDRLGDQHTVLGTFEPPHEVYEVIFTSEQPDFWYFTDYVSPAKSPWEFLQEGYDHFFGDVPSQSWTRITEFLRLGIEHILEGYDHLAFLFALLLVVDRFGTLLKIITSFTVAHSITLALAALDVVRLPSSFIEASIAATIMYVSFENLWAKGTGHRWMLTFVFGLIHGFGFANVLAEQDLPTGSLVRCLVSFNLGVEIGQVLVVAAVWPIWRLLRQTRFGPGLTKVFSIAIFLFGAAWFTDRVTGLGFMPF